MKALGHIYYDVECCTKETVATHLDGLVIVRVAVDDRQTLRKARITESNNSTDELRHGDDHLEERNTSVSHSYIGTITKLNEHISESQLHRNSHQTK